MQKDAAEFIVAEAKKKGRYGLEIVDYKPGGFEGIAFEIISDEPEGIFHIREFEYAYRRWVGFK